MDGSDDSNKSPSVFVQKYIGFVAGIASGVTKLLVGHPFDTLKIRMQTEGGNGRFKGLSDCFLSTIRKEGPLALYKGASPPLVGWVVMDAAMLGSLNNIKLFLQGGDPNRKLELWGHALAGGLSGCVVAFVSTPIEVVKGRLQLQYDSATKKYAGPLDCARQLIRQDGIKGLYKGLSGCLLFRGNFWILWMSYEIYNQKLREWSVTPSLHPFLAGGLGATTFWLFGFPADVIKNRMMTQDGMTTIFKTAKYVWKKEGPRGFYHGFLPCFMRSFPTNGAAILAYETCMSLGRRHID